MINGGRSFIVWMAEVLERFLAYAVSPLTTVIFTAIRKMHIRHFVKQIPIQDLAV
jgi:hypothetical protein